MYQQGQRIAADGYGDPSIRPVPAGVYMFSPPPMGISYPGWAGDLDGEYGAAIASCEVWKKRRAYYLKRMWATPIFTRARVEWERKANAAARAYKVCADRAAKVARGRAGKVPALDKLAKAAPGGAVAPSPEASLAPVEAPGMSTGAKVGLGALALALVGGLWWWQKRRKGGAHAGAR